MAGLLPSADNYASPRPQNVFGDVGSKFGNERLQAARDLAMRASGTWYPFQMAGAGILGALGLLEKGVGYGSEIVAGDTASERRLANDLLAFPEAFAGFGAGVRGINMLDDVTDAAVATGGRVAAAAPAMTADAIGAARAIARGDTGLLSEVLQRGGTPQSLSAMYARDGGSVGDAVKFAQSGDAIFHSSAPSQFDEINRWGVEPSYGPWVREVAAGSVDDVDEFLANAPEAAWWSDQPDWVLGKAAREARKPVSELTVDDVRRYGHLSIGSADEYSDLAFRIPEEGLDYGEHTYVEDLAGNRMRLFETPLYEYNDYGGSSYPFGIERNEIVTREAIDPLYSLTGDELIDFMRQYDPEGFGGLLSDPITQRGDEILNLLKSGRGNEVTDEMLDMGDSVQNARLNEYLFNNYDLPMDQASRMARAREMGLLDDAYHATGAEFQQFIPSQVGRHGAGVYTGKNASDVQTFLPKDEETRRYAEGSQVLPLRIPDDAQMASEMKWQDALPERWNYGDPKDVTDAISGYAEAADALSQSGFKGVAQPATDWDGRVIFDPRNIRSRFARFDPRLSHLRSLSAGIGAMGLLGAMGQERLDQETRNYLAGGA